MNHTLFYETFTLELDTNIIRYTIDTNTIDPDFALDDFTVQQEKQRHAIAIRVRFVEI